MKINVFLVFVLIFSQCFSKKHLTENSELENKKSQTTFLAKPLIDSVIQNHFPYKNIQLKYSASVEDENEDEQNVAGTIKIVKDSAMWISVTALMGIEVFRLFLTPDSLKYINRLKSTYYVGNYEKLKQTLNTDIDFFMLQSILTNYIFSNSKNGIRTLYEYSFSLDSNYYVLNSPDSVQEIRQKIHIDAKTFKIKRLFTEMLSQGANLSLSYDNFSDFESRLFPQNLFFQVNTRTRFYKILLNYEKISFNGNEKMPFKISEKFKPE